MSTEVIMEAFSSPVLWDYLGKYLSFHDFTELRLVSHAIKEQVDNCQSFLLKAYHTVFVLPRLSNDFYFQNSESWLKCRQLKIVFCATLPQKVLGIEAIPAAEALDNVRGIKLAQLLSGKYPQPLASQDRWQIILLEMLKLVPTLQYLSIHINIFSKIKMDQIIDTLSWRPCPIKSLSIYTAPIFRKIFPESDIAALAHNLDAVAEAMQNLRHFSFIDETISLAKGAEVFRSIADICHNNAAGLTGLEIIQPSSITGVLSDAVYPQLRVLKIRTRYQCGEVIAGFLLRQPPLQVLELNFADFLPKSVYDAFAIKSDALNILHIKGKSFGPGEEPGDWTFLSELTSLEKLDIRASSALSGNLATFDSILGILPKTVQKIYLRGLPSIRGGTDNFSTVSCFENLTELGIRRCNNAVNASFLRGLFSNGEFQRSIQVFHLSDCDQDINSVLPGVNNLRNLRSLTIQACWQITNFTLKQIRLPLLKQLDVSRNPKVTRDGIVPVAQQCTNLAFLKSSWGIGKQLPGTSIRLLRVDDPTIVYYDSEDDFF